MCSLFKQKLQTVYGRGNAESACLKIICLWIEFSLLEAA